jgi:glycosyltransferase involved in cell wall biosynthesis
MTFLLVVSTLSRTTELPFLFESLCKQTHKDFVLVLVDQNPDDRLVPVVQEFSERIRIHHIRSGKGLSKGRNVGLSFMAEGDVVAFPDDDCTYPPTLLERLADLFDEHPEWDVITGRSVTESGEASNGRWDQEPGRVTIENVWNRATSFSIFARRSAMSGIRFDENLGLGDGEANSLWGSSEDIDFVLQLIRRRQYVQFDPTIKIHHPDWSITGYNPAVYNKAKAYGRGMGRVLRKHGYPLRLVVYHLIRPIGGTILSILRGRLAKARYHWSMFLVRLHGWTATMHAAE